MTHISYLQVRIIRRIEEAFEHLAGGGKIEELAPMKEVKGQMSTLNSGMLFRFCHSP